MLPTEQVTLYTFESPEINISLKVYFNPKNELVFDGYDFGDKVLELLGTSDYEYTYKVSYTEVQKLAALLNVRQDDKKGLLQAMKKRFCENDAYSKFGVFMTENNIAFTSFSWR